MRKIILFIASSLDGYIARENGDIDWLPETGSSGYDDFIKSVDTVVMGKKTYDQVLTFGGYPYKDKKSYVFTRNKNLTKDEDIEFVAYRSGGKGGQNVNKVSTAVRIKHIPSGLVVENQTERTQGKNREKAMQVLKARLYAIEVKRLEEEKRKLKGQYVIPGWGSQIRNYVLHPYKLVKDLRTEVESTNPDAVLDGDLDKFIEAEIKL